MSLRLSLENKYDIHLSSRYFNYFVLSFITSDVSAPVYLFTFRFKCDGKWMLPMFLKPSEILMSSLILFLLL